MFLSEFGKTDDSETVGAFLRWPNKEHTLEILVDVIVVEQIPCEKEVTKLLEMIDNFSVGYHISGLAADVALSIWKRFRSIE